MPSTGTPLQPQADDLSGHADAAWRNLSARVDGVRARQRVKFAGTGVLAALAVFVAAFLGFSAADILFKLSVNSRVVVLGATLIAAVFALYRWLYRPLSRMGGNLQSAREVESAFPQLEQQLSTALEFGADKRKAETFASPALVAALVSQAGERSKAFNFVRTIRWRQLAVAFALAFVLALLMALYAARNSRLFAATWARFTRPTADIAAPTLTEIKSVEPGDGKYALETSVPVAVALEGKLPDTATLSVLIGDESESHWEDRPMDRGDDGKYHTTLRRLLDTAKYKIHAGDAESREFTLKVFKTPEIAEFSVRLEHPSYTGKGTETLAPGMGDIRALKGSKIHFDLKANVELGKASVAFKSKRPEIAARMTEGDKRKATLSFELDKDDDYQLKIADADGNPGAGQLFQIKALRDHFPRVTILKPEKDLMAFKEQTVEVEISAEDDIGVKEIGIFHSAGLDEKQVLVKRMDPQPIRAGGKLVWELGTMDLKGGEVISYYAYAIDNDTVSPGGPKMSKSDIHFLTIYDEEKYDQEKDPRNKKPPGTPPAIKQLDKLIDAQKKLLKETFAQARLKDSLREKDDSERAKSVENEKTSAAKTGEAQKQLRARVEDLIEKVKTELLAAGDPEAHPREGDPQTGPKQQPAMGEKEIKHLETAVEKMVDAEKELRKTDAPAAVRPENEALRHLSETRRLLLSDKEGDPRFKMAMNKQAKKNNKKDQNQQQQDQQQAKQELAQMPKMMEKQKELERELEELSEKKRKPPQGEPQSEERKQQAEEERNLQRKAEEEAQALAKEAEARAQKLEELANRNAEMKTAAEKMRDAAQKLDDASKQTQQGKPQGNEQAKDQSQKAQQDVREAQRNLRNALEKQVRQEMANLQKDAQELAQRQQDLAQQMPPPQSNEQQKKENGQPQFQEPKDGQKPQRGDGQKTAQQQGSKPEQGQPQQGGQPKDGQPKNEAGSESAAGQSSASKEQKMRGMANAQRDIQSDLKDFNERASSLAGKASEQNLAGAKEVEQAQKQSGENSAAGQAAQKALEALSSAKQDDAKREAANAAKAMRQLAETLTDAKQKTEAGDMKALANAMKKLQSLSREQSEIGKDLAAKKDPSELAAREEQVGDGAKELADAASHLETLRANGAQDTAKSHLEKAAQSAAESAKEMKAPSAPPSSAAKTAADQADKSLAQALADMERAAGKTLEDKARDAKSLAKSALEQQEKANTAIKNVPDNKSAAATLNNPGNKEAQPPAALAPHEAAQRDEAAAREEQAAREARKLNQALEGLKELAKDANPAAADAAVEARETTQKTELPQAMEQLADDMQRLGTDKKAQDPRKSAQTPAEAAKQGEQHAQTLKQVDKHLDNFVAEARNSLEERLKNMEESAQKAAESAKQLAEQNKSESDSQQQSDSNNPSKSNQSNQGNPNKIGEPKNNSETAKADDQNKSDPKRQNPDNKNPEAQTGEPIALPGDKEAAEKSSKEQLKKQLKKLQPKIERLEANAPEKVKMKEAIAALEQTDQKTENASEKSGGPPQPGKKNMGGAAYQRVSQALEAIAQGVMERRERLIKARDIRPDEDEDAPREYRTLVDRYYRALSEDVEDERK